VAKKASKPVVVRVIESAIVARQREIANIERELDNPPDTQLRHLKLKRIDIQFSDAPAKQKLQQMADLEDLMPALEKKAKKHSTLKLIDRQMLLEDEVRELRHFLMFRLYASETAED
jgi:hypothetical protein